MKQNICKKMSALGTVPMLAFGIQGCASQTATTGDSFASMYYNTTDTAHFYKALNGKTAVLDYETMETASLCNKPNCTHISTDCIVYRLNGNVPMFSEGKAYYFIDDVPTIVENEDGKPALKLGSTLYCYDMNTNLEEKRFYADGVSVSNNCYGWLLHNGVIYFIGNLYNPFYDENGIMTGYGNTGGRMELYSVDIATNEIQNYGDLYDVTELSQYYPETPHSGEVYMKGFFDNKIYFNVAFSTGMDYSYYVMWFDLNTETYCGEPENYAAIDFGAVSFASNDYLAISSNQKVTVYRSGEIDPIVFYDEAFYQSAFISVFDDTVYANGKAYDLNTHEVRSLDNMEGKSVVAKYGDSYIISDLGMQSEFEKIPATDLLSE